MSATPEGYVVAPTTTDHIVKLAVPVPGRAPILIEAPAIPWLPPEQVDDYEAFGTEILEAERELEAWHKANDDHEETLAAWHDANDELPEDERAPQPKRTPFPAKKAKLVGEGDPARQDRVLREMKLRWLKPHMPEDEYEFLLTSRKIPERTISWIVEQLSKPGDITVGESGASADS
jgi:hypothetical protein